ncbi:hypothetical protein F5Y10DRAFT_257719 [Nemania abortiva]|nr:hypothetical protein F5Y10DRAFT_257719 [Nemania abortiva]
MCNSTKPMPCHAMPCGGIYLLSTCHYCICVSVSRSARCCAKLGIIILIIIIIISHRRTLK